MDLANANNWNLIHTSNTKVEILSVEQYGGYEYKPLPAIQISLASPICLVKCDSDKNVLETWHTAAWLKAKLKLNNQDAIIHKSRLLLNQAQYITLRYFEILPYTLEFDFPPWLREMTLTIWQFTDQSGKYDQGNQQAIISTLEVIEQREAQLAKQLEFLVNRDVVKQYNLEI